MLFPLWLIALLALVAMVVLMSKSHRNGNNNLFNLAIILTFISASFVVFTFPYLAI